MITNKRYWNSNDVQTGSVVAGSIQVDGREFLIIELAGKSRQLGQPRQLKVELDVFSGEGYSDSASYGRMGSRPFEAGLVVRRGDLFTHQFGHARTTAASITGYEAYNDRHITFFAATEISDAALVEPRAGEIKMKQEYDFDKQTREELLRHLILSANEVQNRYKDVLKSSDDVMTMDEVRAMLDEALGNTSLAEAIEEDRGGALA